MAERTPSDRRRRRAPEPEAELATGPNAVVASAALLDPDRRDDDPAQAPWQEQAWAFYDTTPELRQACKYASNSLSRCRLFAARMPENASDDPEELPDDHPASAIMASLAGGITGQSQLLSSFGTQLTVPGQAFLVGTPSPIADDGTPGYASFQVLSADEIKRGGRGKYQLLNEGQSKDLPADTIVTRIWRPHERFHQQPDSPTRGTLRILRQMQLLSDHVDAVLTSRLASAGLLLLPNEVTFPMGEGETNDAAAFMRWLGEAMQTAIKNRGSASALAPIVVKVPAEYLERVQHVQFTSDLSDKLIELLDSARVRFATGMDMPAEVILGLAESNHWTAWQIEESALKLNVVPNLEAISQGLTVGYLRPALRALNVDEPDLIVWYDLSNLQVRPDKSEHAVQAFDRKELSGASLRRELGFAETDAPTREELERQLLISIATQAPSLAPLILPLLGIKISVVSNAATGDGEGAPADDDAGPGVLPDTQDAEPDDALAAAALLEACDGMVHRALEKVGNRLRGRTSGKRAAGEDCPPSLMHTCVKDATVLASLDTLLAGAWERLDEVAPRYGCEVEPLRHALDHYTRALVAAGEPHSFDRLVVAMGGR